MPYQYDIIYRRPANSTGSVIGHAENEEDAAGSLKYYRQYYEEQTGYSVPHMVIKELCPACAGSGYTLSKNKKGGLYKREITCPAPGCKAGVLSERTVT